MACEANLPLFMHPGRAFADLLPFSIDVRWNDERFMRPVEMHARRRNLLAAGAHGVTAIDAIRTDIADLDGAHAEAVDAAASGFGAKAAIHPNHVEPYRRAFAPTAEQLDEARRILAAAEATPGVFSFEGRMVDEPILRHARSVVARAGAAGAA